MSDERKRCPACNGLRQTTFTGLHPCPVCRGAGTVPVDTDERDEALRRYRDDPEFHAAVHYILQAEGDEELIVRILHRLLPRPVRRPSPPLRSLLFPRGPGERES